MSVHNRNFNCSASNQCFLFTFSCLQGRVILYSYSYSKMTQHKHDKTFNLAAILCLCVLSLIELASSIIKMHVRSGLFVTNPSQCEVGSLDMFLGRSSEMSAHRASYLSPIWRESQVMNRIFAPHRYYTHHNPQLKLILPDLLLAHLVIRS